MTSWTSQPFPSSLGAKLIGPKAVNVQELNRRYPALSFKVHDVVPVAAEDPNTSALTISPRRPVSSEYEAQRRKFVALFMVLTSTPINWTFGDIYHLLGAESPTQRLCWTRLVNRELMRTIPLALDAPGPYYLLCAAPDKVTHKGYSGSDSDESDDEFGLKGAFSQLSLGTRGGLGGRNRNTSSRQGIRLLAPESIDEIARMIARRNKEMLLTAAEGTVMKLKAIFGMTCYPAGKINGPLAQAVNNPVRAFTAADVMVAADAREIRGSFAVSMPVAAEDALVRLLKGQAFKLTKTSVLKVVASFTLDDNLPKALAIEREYVAKFVYDEAAKVFVKHPKNWIQYDSVAISKTSVITLPKQHRGVETELPLSFRIRHLAHEPLAGAEELPEHIRSRILDVANALLTYTNANRAALLHAHRLGDGDNQVGNVSTPALPSLPVAVQRAVSKFDFRVKDTTRLQHRECETAVTKVVNAFDRESVRPIPLQALLAITFRHTKFSALGPADTPQVVETVKRFISVVRAVSSMVRVLVGSEANLMAATSPDVGSSSKSSAPSSKSVAAAVEAEE
ncbi:hypothetical protein BC828DRAFT_379501 [Blastocladiella britannica]|nr:hypothetical protein BC828DRAFT_379501 [Blastocladiella britannica]